jgi:acetyltransferase-like isoleucine patch superfamily enzyme
VTILGNVQVGDNAVVGAHSLVLQDLPPGCLAYGVPAKVVKTREEAGGDSPPNI